MMFVELFVPKERFSAEELSGLAARLTLGGLLEQYTALESDAGTDSKVDVGADPSAEAPAPASTPPAVLALLESITHVVVHEVATWVVGGRPLDRNGPTRYFVRAYVPGRWRKELTGFLVTSITRALSQAEGDSERLTREPHAEVHVLGVPEGGYGAFGRSIGESDLLDMIHEAVGETVKPAPAGSALDPVCGMTVPINDQAVSLELDGQTFYFCCGACRRHFADQQDAARLPG
ncbi:hypothetical protein GCM10023317_27340 [Actinopolymorpha pittospori]